ncbi:putative serine/threonine-protein kinase-like protein CCR3 [Oryza sativa Japonica Group]|uniref:putative serine/threonine-protein kinase-like protein CCR3 n=1 Tax=Oryza sativa subsp. japonica TaxID=39947 RepID=UPI00339BB460
MALWSGLGQAATVAQLVGADVGSLISMIVQAAVTAQHNKKECEQLARRAFMIAELLPHLRDPEVVCLPEIRRPLVGLDDTLREAHELVMSCQEKSVMHRLVMAGRQAERFREVQSRIDSYLLVFPFISHIDITRRLDRIYRVLLPNDHTPVPSPSAGSQTRELELAEEAAQEVVFRGEEGEKFTIAELATATNNFASDRLIGRGGVGNVYMGRLPDGREVAIKHFPEFHYTSIEDDEFNAERIILSRIRHKGIIRLFGCWPMTTEPLLVFEYMRNSSLDKHLHGSLSSSSPVATSWSMRMGILLGVSRAIEYLHTHPTRPVIHRDIKPSNILLDEAWVPRLSDFGLSVAWDGTDHCCDLSIDGTLGYIDPEYFVTHSVKPTIDVYSFGVVMLEVLTGIKPIFKRKEKEEEDDGGIIPTSLLAFALPIVEAGEVRKVLDRRPTPEPTPRQLQAVELVAQTAACCVRLEPQGRPAISEVVANLQAAIDLISSNDDE